MSTVDVFCSHEAAGVILVLVVVGGVMDEAEARSLLIIVSDLQISRILPAPSTPRHPAQHAAVHPPTSVN